MSKFIEFDDTLVNSKHIICLFPSEYDFLLDDDKYDEDIYLHKYLIIMRLDNNSSLEWKFDNEYDRNDEYNWLKQILVDE